jgi:hypothetical protein
MKTATTLSKISPNLQESLLAAVDALSRRRACDIPEQTIERFVALRWLQWNGGSLRLTEAGEMLVLKLQGALVSEQRLAA